MFHEPAKHACSYQCHQTKMTQVPKPAIFIVLVLVLVYFSFKCAICYVKKGESIEHHYFAMHFFVIKRKFAFQLSTSCIKLLPLNTHANTLNIMDACISVVGLIAKASGNVCLPGHVHIVITICNYGDIA